MITPQKERSRSDCFTHSPHQQISQGDIHGYLKHLNRSRQPTQFSCCLNFKPTERYVSREDQATLESHNGDHPNAITSPSQTDKVKRSEEGNQYSHSYSLCSYYDSPPQDDTEGVIYSEGEQFEGDLCPENTWDSQESHVETEYSLFSNPM